MLLFVVMSSTAAALSSAFQTRPPSRRRCEGRGLATKLRKSRDNCMNIVDVSFDEPSALKISPSSLMASSAREGSDGSSSSGGGGRSRRRGESSSSSSAAGGTTSASSGGGGPVSPLLLRLQDQRDEVHQLLRHKQSFEAVGTVEAMFDTMDRARGGGDGSSDGTQQTVNGGRSSVGERRDDDGVDAAAADEENVRDAASRLVDEAAAAVTNRAFAPPYGPNALGRIALGLEVAELQLSSASLLSSPFGTLPRWTWLNALRALTGVAGQRPRRRARRGPSSSSPDLDPASEAYQILQRLVTGRGVRAHSPNQLDERDFSMVLNAFVKTGRMDMAHRIVALQERTDDAPPLSPVAYSILIKGYGKRRDAENIDMLLRHAKKNGIVPDTIMYNSLIDGYVNCDMVDEAYSAFMALFDDDKKGGMGLRDGPTPNVRTYNTMLKGFAKRGDLSKALKLSERMEGAGLWDDITTNTLVNVAVKADEFDVAEEILNNHTGSFQSGQGRNDRDGPHQKRDGRKHPNVEAYTEIIDGYAKAGALDKALGTLQLMRKRGVAPNEYTYTCVIGAMARAGKVLEAKKMLGFMASADVQPTVITYNALITGMLADPPPPPKSPSEESGSGGGGHSHSHSDAFLSEDQASYNTAVVDSLGLLTRMIKAGVLPDPITVSSIVEGMGRCRPARLNEARTVLAKLEKDGLASAGDERVGTALIRACAQGGDFDGSVAAFRGIANPDLVAFNAFLDSCCRCGNIKVAFEVFKKFVGRAAGTSSGGKGRAMGSIKQKPDVITFTILISALLKTESLPARKRVYRLYQEMRMWGITPDPSLVDVILEAMTRGGPFGLSRENVKFTAKVLKDAEAIKWGPGELEKRKRAVRGILIYGVGEVWQGKEDEHPETVDDVLFAMKGWNKVDSGFRLWGGVDQESRPAPEDGKDVDEFLDSHGWNDVSSGFRLF